MHLWPMRHRRATLVIVLGAALTACQSTTRPVAPETAASVAAAQPSAAASSAAAVAAPQASVGGGITTSSGLQYIEVAPGNGPAPQPGDVVSVHYTGMLTDGTVFDSSRERNEPFQFPLGQGRVIPGWDEGIALMREGGQARLIIPPELGYGASGAGGVIPPNATLIFDVELVDVP
ncbi:MAG: FKBP-type peptidyl-prolyl cis-trans isomerase [Chloroflexota bacterium]|nr:FKBP-type peptidyl-prolyl cis-trans isomerase [Chloroflexota bacterium]